MSESISVRARIVCEHPKLVKKVRHRWNYPFGRKNKAVMGGIKKIDYYCAFCGVKVRSTRS